MSKATIERLNNGAFAVIGANREIIRGDFKSKQMACMRATRKGFYKPQTPRRRQIDLPPDLGDLRVVKCTHAATTWLHCVGPFF
jgi:hypothetical protein